VTNEPLKVLCITGWCRNGSTIIGNILGEVPGCFHVGELHFLWRNSVGKGANNRCGCGSPLTECQVWAPILASGRPAGMSAEEFADLVTSRQQARVRTRHTWRVLRHGLDNSAIRAHADLMTRTYHAIAERTGARVIVDTNKLPGESALLPHMDGITPYYVHLVRDPRAVAGSWSTQKDYVYVLPPWTSTGYWLGFNLAAAALTRRYPQRSMFLRYEDFIAAPEAVIASLLRLAGLDTSANPVHDRKVDLRVNHTVTGNPDRFSSGPTLIRETDDSWRAKLSGRAKLLTTAMALPLSARYGYLGR
jgi:hypothetical protein